ncbi:MAG: TonB-dependent receptor [Bacteroidia bacterium]|nr:TonB-dependent receptor [Bacteroidia bacterium]
MKQLLRYSLGLVLMCWCLTSVLYAQTSVSGKVVDKANGTALTGVSVVVKGTARGALTDNDGNFKINASAEDVLLFSYYGFTDFEVEVGSQTVINVSLSEDVASLSEVVIVGYGTQQRRTITGAISSIDAKAVGSIPTGSSLQAMQGQVAGVDVTSQGGRPGQGSSIQIRGRRSITASNDPLYVIDGIPMTSTSGGTNSTGTMFDINPQDIESIEVLKDASATAIYGSRGANGVVLITTKRGASGKTVFSYDTYYGTTNPLHKVDMMNGEEFAAMKRESRRRDPVTNQVSWNGVIPTDDKIFTDPVEQASLAATPIRSTDYQDLILGSGYQTNHQLGLRGGTQKTLFNVSVGVFDEQGIIVNQDFKRLTGRVNLDHIINDRFKVGTSTMVSYSIQNWGSNATLGEALPNNPLGVPYNDAGGLIFLPTNDGIRTNPLNEVAPNAYIDERRFARLFPSLYAEAKIFDGLTFRSNLGADFRYRRNGIFTGSLTNTNRGGPAKASVEHNTDLGYTWENVLTYQKKIGSIHDLKITALQSIQQNTYEQGRVDVANLPYESALFYNLGVAEVRQAVASRLEQWSLSSFMGRVNYDIAGKYLLQLTLRADGSSRLAEGNKWHYFPGVSLGWRIVDEGFMKNVKWVDELKLRGSYGSVGNTSVSPYQTLGGLRRTVYSWDEVPAFGFGLNQIPNPELGWEVSSTTDIGLDFGFFQGRISGSFDWFLTNTTDIILQRSLPPTSGYSSVLQNIGATRTSGQELTLNANAIYNPDGLRWDITLNLSRYDEEIVELALRDENGNPIDDIGNRWFIGEPIRVFYDYEKIGIWQKDEVDMAKAMENKVPGEIKLKDQDGDGLITPADRIILGSDVPDFYGGLTNRFEFKGIDFSFFVYFKYGQMIRSRFHDDNNSLFARYNNLDVDYWTIDNPSNENPRPNENQEFPRDGSTRSYFDGSFLKLRNVSLGYTFPNAVAEKLKMSRLRVYASAQNVYFFSKYESYDPENNDDINTGDVPTSRLVLLGINLQF